MGGKSTSHISQASRGAWVQIPVWSLFRFNIVVMEFAEFTREFFLEMAHLKL